MQGIKTNAHQDVHIVDYSKKADHRIHSNLNEFETSNVEVAANRSFQPVNSSSISNSIANAGSSSSQNKQ